MLTTFSLISSKDINELSNEEQFNIIAAKAKKQAWESFPMELCLMNVAKEFIGSPYLGGTLEGDGPEICRVDLSNFDCVTFFENSLAIARTIKKGKSTYQDFLNELTYMRYRSGRIDGYTSRLHYTSDWIYDNVMKKVVDDITMDLEGTVFDFNVSFMSKHPQHYVPLKNNQTEIKKIRDIEKTINSRKYFIIPKDKVKGIMPQIRPGDIICIATDKKGLDYSHIGLSYLNEETGIIHLLHASSTQKKVVVDKALDEYLANVKSHIGITVVRPLDITNYEK